jgi:hypothetical protein
MKKPDMKTRAKRWYAQAKVGVKSNVVATLTKDELYPFIQLMDEMDGLRRAIGKAEGLWRMLWDRAAIKYGFDPTPKSHIVDFKTGEIRKTV